jgi:hypothetical protein
MPLASHSGVVNNSCILTVLYRPAISRSPPLATRSLARSHARGVPGTIVLEPSEVRFRVGTCSRRASARRSRRGAAKRERATGKMRTVPARELVGDLKITVAILNEPPAAAPRVWHVIQMGVKHVYHARDEHWPLHARRLRQLHARSRDDARAGAVARAYRRLARVHEHGRSVNAQETRELVLGRVNGRKRVRAPISRLWKHAWTHQPDDGQQSEGSDARGRRAQY